MQNDLVRLATLWNSYDQLNPRNKLSAAIEIRQLLFKLGYV